MMHSTSETRWSLLAAEAKGTIACRQHKLKRAAQHTTWLGKATRTHPKGGANVDIAHNHVAQSTPEQRVTLAGSPNMITLQGRVQPPRPAFAAPAHGVHMARDASVQEH